MKKSKTLSSINEALIKNFAGILVRHEQIPPEDLDLPLNDLQMKISHYLGQPSLQAESLDDQK